MAIRRDRLLISAFSSGTGKTLFASVITSLLRQRRHAVRAFKYSADFIDAHVSSCADGQRTQNISYWALGGKGLIRSFVASSSETEIALVEGGAGILDAKHIDSFKGSTAHFASLIDAPVLLVCDVDTSPQSTVLLIEGLRRHAPRVRIAGILGNRVRDVAVHFRRWKSIVGRHAGLPVLGYLPYREEWSIGGSFYPLLAPIYDRHIGETLRSAAAVARETIDIRRIERICRSAAALPYRRQSLKSPARKVRIAVADGMAFYSLFQENIDLLKRHGAEIVPFCPMTDERIPDGVDGLYISGRFPEPFGPELEANMAMKKSIARVAGDGIPVYAEGGGLKYLSDTMTDDSGMDFRMAGVIPARTSIARRRGTYGLVRIGNRGPTNLLRKGATAKGYLFPNGIVRYRPARLPLRLTDAVFGEVVDDGYVRGNVFATIAHINWLTCPSIARNFVRRCVEYRKAREKRLQ